MAVGECVYCGFRILVSVDICVQFGDHKSEILPHIDTWYLIPNTAKPQTLNWAPRNSGWGIRSAASWASQNTRNIGPREACRLSGFKA